MRWLLDFVYVSKASAENAPSNLVPNIVSYMRQQLHAWPWQSLPQAPFSFRSPMQQTRGAPSKSVTPTVYAISTSLRSNIVCKKNSFEVSAFPSSTKFGFDKRLQQSRTLHLFSTQDYRRDTFLCLPSASCPAHKPLKPMHPAHVIAPGSTHTNPCKDIKHTELTSGALKTANMPNHRHASLFGRGQP